MLTLELTVDAPLRLRLDASGRLDVECYHALSDGQTAALRLALTPQAAAALFQAIGHLRDQGIDPSADAKPPTQQ